MTDVLLDAPAAQENKTELKAKDAAGLLTGEEGNAASKHRKVPATNLFKETAKEEKELAAKRDFDRKVSMLIGKNKLDLLREFGYDVVTKINGTKQ